MTAPLYPPPFWRTGGFLDAAGTTVSVPWPAAHRAGDLMIVAVNSLRTGTISVSANPTGWLLISNQNVDAGTSATADHQTSVYICRATSSSMPTPTFLNASSDYMLAAYGQIRGASEKGTALDAVNAYLGEQNTNGLNTFTWGAVTTTVDDCLIVHICGTGEATIATSGYSGAAIFFDTERIEAETAQGGDGSIFVATGVLEPAGSSGTATATPTVGTRAQSRFTIAIMPPQLDTTAPVVAATPASASSIATADSIQIDVTDAYGSGLAAVAVVAIYPGGTSEDVYSGGDFGARFQGAANAETAITNGTRLVIEHDDGWQGDSLTLRVVAVDSQGNTTTSDLAYTVTDYEPEVLDAVPPTITLVSPPGGELAANTPIVVDVEDDLEISIAAVLARYSTGRLEVVHTGAGFGPHFSAAPNEREILDAGLRQRFTILRDGGWSPRIGTPRIEFLVRDAAGNAAVIA